MKKGAIAVIICAVIFLSVVISAFIYFSFIASQLTLEPEVRVTNTNYNKENTSDTFWEPSIWKEFEDEYNGKFSIKLQEECVESMRKQAKELGEDSDLLEDCIDACGEFDEPEYHASLPCLAEKAKFNNTDVWIIVYIWGFESNDLGHIRFYVIDISNLEILQFETCG